MPRTAIPKALLKFDYTQLAAAANSKRQGRLVELKSQLREVEATRSALIAELGELGESVSGNGSGRRRGRPPGSRNRAVSRRARGGKRGGRKPQKHSVASRALLYLSDKGEATVENIRGALKIADSKKAAFGVALSNLKKRGALASAGRGSWRITPTGKDAAKSIQTSR